MLVLSTCRSPVSPTQSSLVYLRFNLILHAFFPAFSDGFARELRSKGRALRPASAPDANEAQVSAEEEQP